MAGKPVRLTDVSEYKRLEARVAALEAALGFPPGIADWTPDQVAAFQAELDGLVGTPEPAPEDGKPGTAEGA